MSSSGKQRSASAMIEAALSKCILLEASDSLAGLQGVEGQSHSFVEHIQIGVKHAEADPSSLLLFSGGQTRRAAGPRSEAEGYWMVAAAAGWWGHNGVQDRAFTEVPHLKKHYAGLI